jgi:pyrroline-5-carboxylate reductase
MPIFTSVVVVVSVLAGIPACKIKHLIGGNAHLLLITNFPFYLHLIPPIACAN